MSSLTAEGKPAAGKKKSSSSSWLYCSVVFPFVIAASLVYTPGFWIIILMYADFLTPWVLFESKAYDMYHEFLVSRLTERPELPILTVSPEEATPENLKKLSKGYTFPIIIKGMLKNSTSLTQWNDRDWWVNNYGPDEVLCGTLEYVVEECNVKAFFDAHDAGKPFYISGASEIFEKHPELHDMVDSPAVKAIEPGFRTATQIFMGFPDMGSDIHCAIGINIFRQITGRKKWWFIPPSQTPYLKPSLNVRGISAHTKTLIGKEGNQPSPWLTKLERYVAVLDPGDVLINPPWFWHGILNLGEANDIIIGTPSRYGGGITSTAALRSNPWFTLEAYLTIFKRYGPKAMKPGFKMNLQQDIANNRRSREKKELKEAPVDVWDEDAPINVQAKS